MKKLKHSIPPRRIKIVIPDTGFVGKTSHLPEPRVIVEPSEE